jgi:hypothetical protein
MERDDLALDGLLRELARAPQGDDEAFVGRVLAGTRKPSSHRPVIVAAAALLISMGALFAFPPPPATGRVEFRRAACLVPDATHLRVLLKEPESGRLLLLGQAPIDADVRVPAGAPLLLQALGADGMARWTSPDVIRVRPSPPTRAAVLDARSARSVEFARDVKPILDQHCSGCHAESDLVRAGVKPFEARRSPIVTQTHALLSSAERLQMALWVDLGAPGRP